MQLASEDGGRQHLPNVWRLAFGLESDDIQIQVGQLSGVQEPLWRDRSAAFARSGAGMSSSGTNVPLISTPIHYEIQRIRHSQGLQIMIYCLPNGWFIHLYTLTPYSTPS